MFYFVDGIASGRKHAARTSADQSAQTGKNVDGKKVKQNGGLFHSNESSVLSFVFVM